MRYLARATGQNADEVMADAHRKITQFAGSRDWSIEDVVVRRELVRGDGMILLYYADVEAWVED